MFFIDTTKEKKDSVLGIARQYKLTFIGLFIGLAVAIVSYIFELDPFDNLVVFFNSLEEYEIDELFIGSLIFMTFFLIDLIIHQKNQKIEMEKVKIYKAMVSSTHHILNNFLNQMLIFKLTAEDTPGFDPNILKLYDEIIKDAKQQLEALSSVEKISPETIKDSVRPK